MIVKHYRNWGIEYDIPFVQVERPNQSPDEGRFAIVPGTTVKTPWADDPEWENGEHPAGIVLSVYNDAGDEVTILWSSDPVRRRR